MKISIMMIFLIICSSCSQELKRMENDEVICYFSQSIGYSKSDLQCYFKYSLKIKDGSDALSIDSTPNN